MKNAIVVLALLLAATPARATVVLSQDAEGYSDGQTLDSEFFYCNAPCEDQGKAEQKSDCDPASGAPMGNRCFRWDIEAGDIDIYTEIQCTHGGCNHVLAEGDTLWLAWQMNIQSAAGGADVWHEGAATQDSDKGVGMHGGDSADFRWDVSVGQWDSCMPANTDHKYSVWAGNPTNHFNQSPASPDIEGCAEYGDGDIIPQNVSPYSVTNYLQMDYNRWYNIIQEIKFNDADPKEGIVRVYVNGTKVVEYTGIQTAGTFSGSNIDFDYIEFHGTLCQPSYDCPAHTRYYDAFIVATTAAEVSAYMSDPEAAAGSGSIGLSSTGGSMTLGSGGTITLQ